MDLEGNANGRRRRANSISTPYEGRNGATNRGPNELQSSSAYNSPYGIPPPTYSYLGTPSRAGVLPQGFDLAQGYLRSKQDSRGDAKHEQRQNQKRHDLADSILDWYSMSRSGTHEVPPQTELSREGTGSGDDYADDGSNTDNDSVRKRGSGYSINSSDSEVLHPESHGNKREYANKHGLTEDIEKEALRQMDYRTRRKHIQRIRIQFNISSKALPSPSVVSLTGLQS